MYVPISDSVFLSLLYSISDLRSKLIRIIKYLRELIEHEPDSASYSLTVLLPLVGPGGHFTESLDMPWEIFLKELEQKIQSKTLKTRVMLYRIQSKMFAKDYKGAITILDKLLANQFSDTLWFLYQLQKIAAYIAMSDCPAAERIFDDMKSKGDQIDPEAMIEYRRMIDLASGTGGTAGNIPKYDPPLTTTKIVNESYILEQNYPNPFNPITIINYQLPVDNWVTLKVYDVMGREVITLVDEMQTAGYKHVEWNTSGISSGLYFYRLSARSISGNAGNFSSTKKMLLLR